MQEGVNNLSAQLFPKLSCRKMKRPCFFFYEKIFFGCEASVVLPSFYDRP